MPLVSLKAVMPFHFTDEQKGPGAQWQVPGLEPTRGRSSSDACLVESPRNLSSQSGLFRERERRSSDLAKPRATQVGEAASFLTLGKEGIPQTPGIPAKL